MINLGAEEKQDFSEPEYKFPKFFTISGYMETQSNPEINDEYHSIIKPIEREITRKEMEMRIITKTTRNINISLTHFEDMEQSQKESFGCSPEEIGTRKNAKTSDLSDKFCVRLMPVSCFV